MRSHGEPAASEHVIERGAQLRGDGGVPSRDVIAWYGQVGHGSYGSFLAKGQQPGLDGMSGRALPSANDRHAQHG
jgi:hypothetical protein